MEQHKTDINYQFKALIGLGIIFVVCGHTGCPILSFNGLFNYDSFHMPLFIFASGYFLKEKSNLRKELRNNFKRLIVPLILWTVIYGIILTFLRNTYPFNFKLGMDLSISTFPEYVYRTLALGNASELNVPSWFLLTIFFIKIQAIVIRKLIDGISLYKRDVSILIFYLLVSFMGMWLSKHKEILFLFKIQICRVLYLSFYYELGHFYRKLLEEKDNLDTNKYIFICLLLQCILLFINKGNEVSIIYNMKLPLSYLSTLLFAMNGIAFWLRISRCIMKLWKENFLLKRISNYSIDIMMHHAFILKLINGIFWIMSVKLGLFSEFSSLEYKSNIWYMYLPYGKIQFTYFYAFIGIIGTLIIITICREKKFNVMEE